LVIIIPDRVQNPVRDIFKSVLMRNVRIEEPEKIPALFN